MSAASHCLLSWSILPAYHLPVEGLAADMHPDLYPLTHAIHSAPQLPRWHLSLSPRLEPIVATVINNFPDLKQLNCTT